MRLTGMNSYRFPSLISAAAVALGLALAVAPAAAQKAMPPGTGNTFKDTSMIKPPAGSKVAIYEFEDMECPMCARAFPMVHAAAEQYKIGMSIHDFPLGAIHPWSLEAAIWARYMQDRISPKIADEYRGAVFASQTAIASKDDLLAFTRKFFQAHGGQIPFVPDPTGQFRKEVMEDHALGEKLGLSATPTIFICTDHNWVQVTDLEHLYQAIEMVLAQASPAQAPTMKKASR